MSSHPALLITKKGALDSQQQVIKFISCLPMVGGSLQVLRLLSPLKLVAMILLKVALNTKNQIKSNQSPTLAIFQLYPGMNNFFLFTYIHLQDP